MDDMDFAQELTGTLTDIARSQHTQRPKPPGRNDCADCGDEIPKERRQANPNAQRCADCQTFFERTYA